MSWLKTRVFRPGFFHVRQVLQASSSTASGATRPIPIPEIKQPKESDSYSPAVEAVHETGVDEPLDELAFSSSVQRNLKAVQQKIGYQFRRPELLEEALNQDSCQRLALVGDRGLGLALSYRFYHTRMTMNQFPAVCQPAMANVHLSIAGTRHGIQNYITPVGLRTQKAVANAMEAILGAVFEDLMAADHPVDWRLFDRIIYRLGIVPPSLRTHEERRSGSRWKFTSTRSLPATFFKSHEAVLCDVLFEHLSAAQRGQKSVCERRLISRSLAMQRAQAKWTRLQEAVIESQAAVDEPQGAGDEPQGAGDEPQGAGDEFEIAFDELQAPISKPKAKKGRKKIKAKPKKAKKKKKSKR